MSLRYVNAFAPELPYTLREQVIDYARSVEAASQEIFKEAEVKLTDELRDQLALVAAVRKLHSICSSSYWLLYNSTRLLGERCKRRSGRRDHFHTRECTVSSIRDAPARFGSTLERPRP